MLEVKGMTQGEMLALLRRVQYGHLGCSRDDQPYIVPMNYACDARALYFFTTEGTKTEFIAANHKVCFQVEEVTNTQDWRSVMITGRAERLIKAEDVERAMQLITERNPTLAPALNKTKIGSWSRRNQMVIYCLPMEAMYGRQSS